MWVTAEGGRNAGDGVPYAYVYDVALKGEPFEHVFDTLKPVSNHRLDSLNSPPIL